MPPFTVKAPPAGAAESAVRVKVELFVRPALLFAVTVLAPSGSVGVASV